MKKQVISWQAFIYCLSVFLILFLLATLCFDFPIAIGVPCSTFVFVLTILLLSITFNNERHPLRGDVICAVIAIAGIAGNILGILWFHSGTTVLLGALDSYLFILIVRPALILLFVACFVYLLIRLYILSPGLKESAIRISLLVTIILAYWVSPYIHGSSRMLFLRGLSKMVKEKIEISAIQNWLSEQEIPPREPDSERTAYYLKGVGRIMVKFNQQPEYVKKLTNGDAIYVLYDWEKKEFYIVRAGFYPWFFRRTLFELKLVIGQPAMEIPSSEKGYYGKKVLRLAPGAYVWCGYK